jgi:hypothetical protein
MGTGIFIGLDSTHISVWAIVDIIYTASRHLSEALFKIQIRGGMGESAIELQCW